MNLPVGRQAGRETEMNDNASLLMSQLEEISKLPEVYTASILDSDS